MTQQLNSEQTEVIEAFFSGVYHCGNFSVMVEALEGTNDPQLQAVRGQPNAAAFMDRWEKVFNVELWEEDDSREELAGYMIEG